MLVFLSLLFTTLLLSSPANAQVRTKSFITCVTKEGPKSTSPIKTTSAILTIPWYAYRITTVTPQATVTPKATTVTNTATTTFTTTTTLPQVVDTLSVTVTTYVTTTTTQTQYSNTVVTTTALTTSTGTTTIPAPSGFVPIESSISGSKKRSTDHAGLVAEALNARQATAVKAVLKNGKPVFTPAQYPQGVKCAGIVAVITTSISTATAKTTQTVTATTPTSAVTRTVSTTTTVTQTPARASTTVFITETYTQTNTVSTTVITTDTVTTTVEVLEPTATVYAACADNNLITQRNGQGIVAYGTRGGFSDTTAPNAYECCVQCQTTQSCAGGIFLGGYDCILAFNADEGTCRPTDAGPTVYFDGNIDLEYVAYAGPCGTSSGA